MFSLLKRKIGKALTILVAAISITLICSPSVRAQAELLMIKLLTGIQLNTGNILVQLNNLPAGMTALTKLAVDWLTPDTSTTTADLQSRFGNIGTSLYNYNTQQKQLSAQLISSYFGGATAQNLPNANDLSFQTLLGNPVFAKDAQGNQININAAMTNYIKNASGLNITHKLPSDGTLQGGSMEDRNNYATYYNTVSSVQTYNAFVLSKLYAEAQDKNSLTTQQYELIKTATASDWFTQVSTESIGIVLRQLLMYNSQTYVTLIELLQTQKQLLAAQAMTNTLIVLGNQFNENNLLGKIRR